MKINLQNLTIASTKINRSGFTCKKKGTSLKHKSFISIWVKWYYWTIRFYSNKGQLNLSVKKVNKNIGLIRKLRNSLPRSSLYDQPFSNSFQNKIESIQYNARLAIAGAVRGTSKERFLRKVRTWIPSTSSWVWETLSSLQNCS